MNISGAHILIRTLIEQGADMIFGYPGGTVLGIFDALRDYSDKIRLIVPSHEQGGTHAADGYARVSGKAGVVLATSGPGATNLVTGIANAYMDSIPMIIITGNVGLSLMGRDAFQEIDICGVTVPVTKHNYIVEDIKKLSETVKEAFCIAHSGRPGPVLLDIPKNIAAGFFEYSPIGKYSLRSIEPPSEAKLKLLANMLGKSVRPLIFCGGGTVSSGAFDALRVFAEKINAPVAASLMGLTALPSNHPLMLGMIGMHGTPGANFAGQYSDLLICIGTRFSDRVAGDRNRFAPNAKLVHIDIDPSEFNKNVICDHYIYGDAKTVLERLIELVPKTENSAWIDEIEDFNKNHPPIKSFPAEIMETVNKIAGNNALIATDVGQHQMWTAQYYPFINPKSLITSGGLGAMGFGLGAAIGAKAASPDSPVILVTGDGSFHMNLNELAMSVSENLPVIIIIMNNGTLGMVRQWQGIFYGGNYSATEIKRKTDFIKLADAFGAVGFKAENINEFSKALEEAILSNKTCVIDCFVASEEKVIPMIPPGKASEDILYSL